MTSSCARDVIHITACASFILLVAMVTKSVDGGYGKCPNGKFGHYCRLSCNCRDDLDCDDLTGSCPGSCARGWSGTKCQRQNVVLGMATDMKTPDWSKGARAVDGDAGTCVTSSSNRTGWWRVDMLVQRTVFFMELVFANHTARPGRLRVHVSDYVDTFWGKPCTGIPASHKTTQFSCDLPSNGRFFGIINKDGQITLCEVSVFVCAPFTFGMDCSKECACADPAELCNPITGTCVSGCRDGYTGTSCTEPCTSRYGKACRHGCGHCYDGETCNHVTGVCDKGCASGWDGPFCSQRCEPGTYGPACVSRCHHCLDNATCDPESGLCPWRCESGWRGYRCDTECEPGQHGQNCEFSCGHCRAGSVCDGRSGVCAMGCDSGFDGLYCNTECLIGRWGPNCWYTCGQCLAPGCDKVTGHCSKDGCSVGSSGPRCDKDCRPGTFGPNCVHSCGHCQSHCDTLDGACPTRCVSGWRGRTCVDICSNNKYGLGCISECGRCANNESCHHVMGYCPNGCAEGYKKPFCVIREETLFEQLGRANLLTLLVTCMLLFSCTIFGLLSCLLLKWRRQNSASNSVYLQQRESGVCKQTVV